MECSYAVAVENLNGLTNSIRRLPKEHRPGLVLLILREAHLLGNVAGGEAWGAGYRGRPKRSLGATPQTRMRARGERLQKDEVHRLRVRDRRGFGSDSSSPHSRSPESHSGFHRARGGVHGDHGCPASWVFSGRTPQGSRSLIEAPITYLVKESS